MQGTDTAPTRIKVINIRTSDAVADEFYRLCRDRHSRSGNAQGELILKEWIAVEQAAEAEEAAA